MDLVIDQELFQQSSQLMKDKCLELSTLRTNIAASFSQLKIDWDSDAGKKFFDIFENSLLNRLTEYSKVFEYISENLATASQKYDEVFRDADAVLELQY